jgi:hypothetical protein
MYTNLQTRRRPGQLEFHSLMGIGAGPDPISAGLSAGTALATTALSSWLADKKSNAMNKTYTTTIVNDLEPLLRTNANAYLAGPGTCADQAAALFAFDSAWQWLQSSQACGNLQLGTPGQNCINDRAPGGKWDWTSYYRTPIANDPRVTGCTTAQGADQSAATNVLNHISGSAATTNAGQFSTTTLVDPATGMPVASNPLGALTSMTVAGIPLLYLAGGAVLLFALMK